MLPYKVVSPIFVESLVILVVVTPLILYMEIAIGTVPNFHIHRSETFGISS